jgi:hypothetical protein
VSLELLYIAFVAVCLSRHGLLLPESMVVRQARVEGGFKVLSILWQKVAIALVLDVSYHNFSSEWSYRFTRDGHLRPGITDSVSTLTAGHIDRIKYIYRQVSSHSFRIAVLSSLILVALSGLAPGAVHVITTSIETPMTLHVANLTITEDNKTSTVTDFASQRAFLIMHLENIDHSPFGYSTEGNSIVAWPSSDLRNSSNGYRYPSDVVHYQYSCSWEAPNISNFTWGASVVWSLWWTANIAVDNMPSSGKSLLLSDLN